MLRNIYLVEIQYSAPSFYSPPQTVKTHWKAKPFRRRVYDSSGGDTFWIWLSVLKWKNLCPAV